MIRDFFVLITPVLDIISTLMGSFLDFFDPSLLFGILPYVVIIIAISGLFVRYFSDRFSYSSQSSQFLGDTRKLAVGAILFHFGLIIILLSHLVMFLIGVFFSEEWSSLATEVIDLLEITGWVATIGVILGLILLIIRRLTVARIRIITTKMDWLLLISLLIQVSLGLWIAVVSYPGSVWYVGSITPWFESLLRLNPDAGLISGFAPEIQFHILSGLFIILILPFTRLVHFLSFPYPYLWRPYQRVVWNYKTKQTPE